MINIKHNLDKENGEFVLEMDGTPRGGMKYIRTNTGRMVITHTEVSRELEGGGYGLKLLTEAVNHARENGLKIVPVCPFAKAVLTRNREKYKDVLV